jgi:hypothetical protein
MALWRDLVGDVRRLLLLDDKVGRMEGQLDRIDDRVAHHELRLVQLETAMFGPMPPDRLRLPRQ